MLLGSIKLSDIETLEEIFAVFNGEDWIIPQWLVWMKQEISLKKS